MLLSLFRKDPQRDAARSLYISAMEQSRLPAFYTQFAVPDSFDARFDMVTLHVYLIMRALKTGGASDSRAEECRAMSQKLFEAMFRNLDDTLREMGVGDLSVAKKIRPMAEAFYGRVGAYEAALGSSGMRGGDLRADAPDQMPTRNGAPNGDNGNDADQKSDVTSRTRLRQAIVRNVYGVAGAEDREQAEISRIENHAAGLTDYFLACDAALSALPIGRLLTGIVTFPSPVASQ